MIKFFTCDKKMINVNAWYIIVSNVKTEGSGNFELSKVFINLWECLISCKAEGLISNMLYWRLKLPLCIDWRGTILFSVTITENIWLEVIDKKSNINVDWWMQEITILNFVV